MFKITWTRRASKQLWKVPVTHRKLIHDAVGRLSNWPVDVETLDVKQLKSHKCDYRLRVGRYRVFFDVSTNVAVISVEEVKKRDNRTY